MGLTQRLGGFAGTSPCAMPVPSSAATANAIPLFRKPLRRIGL
jgi:hypothetical protein